jgi:hypothetical protein
MLPATRLWFPGVENLRFDSSLRIGFAIYPQLSKSGLSPVFYFPHEPVSQLFVQSAVRFIIAAHRGPPLVVKQPNYALIDEQQPFFPFCKVIRANHWIKRRRATSNTDYYADLSTGNIRSKSFTNRLWSHVHRRLMG